MNVLENKWLHRACIIPVMNDPNKSDMLAAIGPQKWVVEAEAQAPKHPKTWAYTPNGLMGWKSCPRWVGSEGDEQATDRGEKWRG